MFNDDVGLVAKLAVARRFRGGLSACVQPLFNHAHATPPRQPKYGGRAWPGTVLLTLAAATMRQTDGTERQKAAGQHAIFWKWAEVPPRLR